MITYRTTILIENGAKKQEEVISRLVVNFSLSIEGFEKNQVRP